MDTPPNGEGFGAAAKQLIMLLRDFSGIWTEPAKIKRISEAEAVAKQIATKAEIEAAELLADAQSRLQLIEMRRQHNLNAIALRLKLQEGQVIRIQDSDWTADFVECAKDTGNPTIQDIWAKLLAGEMEAAGSCAKRTLHMVRSLSQTEALLIKAACKTVCCVEEAEGEKVAFINVLVQRQESEIDRATPVCHPLFQADSPTERSRYRQLINCGFLDGDDYDFSVTGEGPLVPEKFELSPHAARQISMGMKNLTLDTLQPGLLLEMPDEKKQQLRMRTPAASIEFYAWRLTPEGEDLFRALNEEPDYGVLAMLGDALNRGGLSVTPNG